MADPITQTDTAAGVTPVRRLIIVDDEQMMRQVLKTIVEQMGHKVVAECSNGAALFKQLPLRPADIVLLDINMPGDDGLTVLKNLREQYPEINVLMISGETSVERVKAAIELGAKDFIAKPFSPNLVMSKLERVLISQTP